MRAMRSIRLVLISLVTLLILAPVSTVFADPPEFLTIDIDDTFVDTFTCSFPIEVHLTGTYEFSIHFDKAGNEVRAIRRIHLEDTETNLLNGKSVSMKDVRAENLKVDVSAPIINDDGSVTYHHEFVGLFWSTVLPGVGQVWVAAGRLDVFFTIAPDGTFLADVGAPLAGHWPEGSPKLCDALAP